MTKLLLNLITFVSIFSFSFSVAPARENKSIELTRKESTIKTKFPKMPAYRPVYCVVTDDAIEVYCQYEATGDILVVDSRTGLTVASETGVELGEGYTLYIPDHYTEAPLTIYVTIADTTYWAEI